MTGIYAMYHGDEFIDIGTIPYLAKRAGTSAESLRHHKYASYLKRHPDGLILIKLDDE